VSCLFTAIKPRPETSYCTLKHVFLIKKIILLLFLYISFSAINLRVKRDWLTSTLILNHSISLKKKKTFHGNGN
jgi:hypothetical protein